MKRPDEYRDHAYALAKAFNVLLALDETLKPHEAWAGHVIHDGKEYKAVAAPPIKDETSYIVVLHEMGHHLAPCGFVRSDMKRKPPAPGCHPRERHEWVGLMLVEEDAAWEWAQHYALEWTVAMEQVKMMCYGTYEEHRKRIR